MENPENDIDAILIAGPTASGKSALALELAKQHGGHVINADSMQVYDTLRVLTARPSETEMGGIPHHLYGHVRAGAAYSTGDWLREAAALIAELRAKRVLPVIVGGTGLYFKALSGGLSDMPEVPAEIRERLRQRLTEEGAEVLHRELEVRDPALAARLNRQDGQRIVRALEVLDATGQSIAAFQEKRGPVVVDPQRARKIVKLPDRSVLHQRINRRFEKMFDEGAVAEVEALLRLGLSPEMPAVKAIGVSQITAMLRGDMTAEQVIEQASAATRQYAKRQMTWLRNQMDDSWERIG
ncbi:tRNA dimethylallyltransferase [Ciceribacter naphthalenivorans]|uniref:tRNA dimethylallyltransferase n=3 Tax=Alphaproteobacteria TaxID=28211 RepID=A0A512HMV4_9HYPH|nr:tRNA (adenosine(37)-N6)-dimethylallyltransferase MiaA [Sphingomonas psychrolutea]GEO86785.1 tRNA dimethylallyltransferase [Ciceribacter naphthalenivorans]GLR23365.1 tRNA dimethylallyltransferase [Ciceribacter naphthalenivorans]GLT06221.1 tRNA dimethylallyltransferase [Sphingomonas psychrolutea]